MLSNQQVTREWWYNERDNFHLFISQAVLIECYTGDLEALKLRAEILKDIEILPVKDELEIISGKYLKELKIPEKSAVDALHLAYAVAYEMDYLLTGIANILLMERSAKS